MPPSTAGCQFFDTAAFMGQQSESIRVGNGIRRGRKRTGLYKYQVRHSRPTKERQHSFLMPWKNYYCIIHEKLTAIGITTILILSFPRPTRIIRGE